MAMRLSAGKDLKIYRLWLRYPGGFAAWLGRARAAWCASACARPTARPAPRGEKVLGGLVENHRRPFVQDFFPTAIYTPSLLSASILGWDGNRRVRSHFSPPGHVTPLPCLTAAGDPAAAAAQIAASFRPPVSLTRSWERVRDWPGPGGLVRCLGIAMDSMGLSAR